jgi:glucan phosphoethanolaminetransferase (alkaline phosphatase superfamily)
MTRGGRITMSVLTAASIGLWLGGLVMLFMSVGALFQTFSRTTAGLGATAIFHRFEILQMILAPVAIVTTFLSVRPGRARKIAIALLVLSAVAAVVITFGISPRINQMRLLEQTDTTTFRRLHATGMATYLAVTHLVAGALVAVVISWRAETSATASAGREFPAELADSEPDH